MAGSIEDLLQEQRMMVLKCMEDAKQALAFNQALSDKIKEEACKSTAIVSVSESQQVSSGNDLKKPLLNRASTEGIQSEPLARQVTSDQKPKTMFGATPSEPKTMRDRVVMALKEKVYNVEDYYKDEGWAQELARSQVFQNLTLFVIALNTIWMAVECDYNKAVVLCEAPLIFQVVDNLFTLYFMFEIFVRWCAFENKRDAFQDGWFKFDSCLVMLMIWETYIFVIIYLLMGGGINSGGLKRLSIFRLSRLLRLTRVARLARVLRAVPELLVLSKAMAMALRSLGATVTLLLLVIYVFSLMFTQLLSQEEIGIGYFETIPQTFNTLLMTAGFWEQREFFSHMLSGGFVYYLLLMFYILVGSYTVLNMLIGVICEVISDVANREREDIMIEDLRLKIGAISELFAAEPGDEEPMVSRAQFTELMNQEEAAQALNEVGVDVLALVDLADFIFPKTGKVPFSKFITLMLQFRGSNTCTVKDIVDMRQYILSELHELESRIVCAKKKEECSQRNPSGAPSARPSNCFGT